MNQHGLSVSAIQFELTPAANTQSDSRTGESVNAVAGPLKTTIFLFVDGDTRVCLVTTHFGWTTPINVNDLFRQTIADELGLPKQHVLIMSSHNHCCVAFAKNAVHTYHSYGREIPPAELLPIGHQFIEACCQHAKRLEDLLQPATVWWAEEREGRITYNRKGRRADGSSYLMREEDRLRLGQDFNGDIDTNAPLVLFRNSANETVAALTQFTGHPVTSYHPEKPIVFGEWPQVACDKLAMHLAPGGNVPVGFVQGCAADVNSKEMLTGTVARSTEFGNLLGGSYISALDSLQPSKRGGMDFTTEVVSLPLASLPSPQTLQAELEEMDDFIRRAQEGDEETLACMGQNFPKVLSPPFRAGLIQMLQRWSQWALEQYESGEIDAVATQLDLEVNVLRLGDVGIVGMPCEPFQEIGRQIRRQSALPLTVPCGYTNLSHGYIPDNGNLGGQEYMSAHHRYTQFRAPLAPPAGDLLAEAASRILNRFAEETCDAG